MLVGVRLSNEGGVEPGPGDTMHLPDRITLDQRASRRRIECPKIGEREHFVADQRQADVDQYIPYDRHPELRRKFRDGVEPGRPLEYLGSAEHGFLVERPRDNLEAEWEAIFR